MFRILVISSNYPSTQAPQVGTFVYELIQEFANQGNEVTVISPKKIKFKRQLDKSYGEEKATVIRPKKLTFSNKKIFFFNTFHLSSFFQARAIKQTIRKINISSNVIYCHFIISGINYFEAFPKSKKSVYIAVGEYHNIDVIRSYYSSQYYKKFLDKVKGFIAVSQQVEQKLLSFGVPQSKIIVEPNATDLNKFKPRNKEEIRRKLGLPLHQKIILFVGRFLENKGPLRVQQALNTVLEDTVAVFIGKGQQQPIHPKIVFSGTVPHEAVAEYMAAADVFVLPTLHEGSSNVIIEAMASGLPIVSSDIPEIKAQCKPEYAILVNPMSVEEISEALNTILTNEALCNQMSKNAVEESKKYDLVQRAKRILDFMKQ